VTTREQYEQLGMNESRVRALRAVATSGNVGPNTYPSTLDKLARQGLIVATEDRANPWRVTSEGLAVLEKLDPQ